MLHSERHLLSGSGLLQATAGEWRRGNMILVLVVVVDGEKGNKAEILHCGKLIGDTDRAEDGRLR
jgi:hypothetical protein